MKEILIDHITKYIQLNDVETNHITKSFTRLNVAKRKVIVAEGGLCPQIYFVVEGCLRMFFLDDKGMEQTIQFALENWWMTDIESFNKKGPASFTVQAVENCILLSISKKDLDGLLEKIPVLEKYFRLIYERAYSASLHRMSFFRLPKDELYKSFCAKYPGFIQRIPQKLIASFLGFTPEYLSELRKKNLTTK